MKQGALIKQSLLKKSLGFYSLIMLGLLLLTGCDNAPEQIQLNGKTMGTYYSIKYLNQEGLPTALEIQKNIDERLAKVNSQMSTYQKDSELSKFNQSSGFEPVTLSANTAKVVAEAIRLNKLTDGALDITVGPLVNLWGFGPQMRVEKKPSDEQIAKARANTGIELLTLDDNRLSKKNPELYLDLSSIAKGFGVDHVKEYFDSLNINNYLVEIGGELQLKGVNLQQQPWRIAIEKPQDGLQSIQEIIAPKDMAIATSGDYRNYFEQDGVRYSHVIDPTTALPISHRVVSVSVLDKSCMTADGLATAFMVLGAKKALNLANKENIPAFFIVKTDEGFTEIASEAFKPYLTQHKK